jgi:hypothetical protein
VLSTESQDVAGSVLVAMQARPTLWARVPADRQAFVNQYTAARTGLRGERRRHGYDCFASVCCFARQDGQEGAPPRIADARGEVVVFDHVGRLHVFVLAGVVLAHQHQHPFVVDVLPRPSHLLLCPSEQLHGLAAR